MRSPRGPDGPAIGDHHHAEEPADGLIPHRTRSGCFRSESVTEGRGKGQLECFNRHNHVHIHIQEPDLVDRPVKQIHSADRLWHPEAAVNFLQLVVIPPQGFSGVPFCQVALRTAPFCGSYSTRIVLSPSRSGTEIIQRSFSTEIRTGRFVSWPFRIKLERDSPK